MKPVIDILIPTWNNAQFLIPCIQSIAMTGHLGSFLRIIIVNNGTEPLEQMIEPNPGLLILNPGENLGWEGGLAYGLKHSDAKFVCFQNDDTQIPKASMMFYERLLMPFIDKSVAAVGPATTTASGPQSMFNPQSPLSQKEVPWLIFFCVMIRREYLDEIGGVDTTLPGGDDMDMSIRFVKAGKKLILNPDAFIIHHGFKTGTRVKGDGYAGVKGGWNSQEMIEKTNTALIQKHGFKSWIDSMSGRNLKVTEGPLLLDLEGDIVRSYVQGEHIVELGCGSVKTVERAIGVDRIPKGDLIPSRTGQRSVADIVADVSQRLPIDDLLIDCVISRHILEHCIDTIKTLKNWNRILKIGGRLVVAVPDEDVGNGIPMNQEHVHAFNQESLASFMDVCGFKKVESQYTKNGVSFVGCYEKVLHPVEEIAEPVKELIHA